MARPILTLTTDFGTQDSYVAQMKGVILRLNGEATIVDVTHGIPAQNIVRGAAILEEVAAVFPPRTIHIAVVDPGVGSDRAILAAEIGEHVFVAPDNGLVSLAAKRDGLRRAVRLTEKRFWRSQVSNTFHGRDVMAPVAAHLSLGVDLSELGDPLPKIVDLNLPTPRLRNREVIGEILWQDSFGNLVTNIDESHVSNADRSNATITLEGQRIDGIDTHYATRPPGTLMALLGSTGRLEIAVSGGSAAEELQARVGSAVRVRVDADLP